MLGPVNLVLMNGLRPPALGKLANIQIIPKHASGPTALNNIAVGSGQLGLSTLALILSPLHPPLAGRKKQHTAVLHSGQGVSPLFSHERRRRRRQRKGSHNDITKNERMKVSKE